MGERGGGGGGKAYYFQGTKVVLEFQESLIRTKICIFVNKILKKGLNYLFGPVNP